MKIVVDFNKCTGLGICESLSPQHFEVEESGELVLLKADVSPHEVAAVEQSVSSCPTEALRIES